MIMALLIVVTLLNVIVATGFFLAGVFFPGFIVRDGEGSQTAKVFALYGVARSVPLLLVVLWAVFRADLTALIWLGLLAGAFQLADAIVGTQTGDKLKVWAPLALGVVQLVAVLLAFWFGA